MLGENFTGATKVSSLATSLFNESLSDYIDYHKPDPIARRQLESWKMSWSEDTNDSRKSNDNANDKKKHLDWKPTNAIEGKLEICGEYVAATIKMECFWTDWNPAVNDDKIEDGRLCFSCKLISGRLIDKKDGEERTERKVRKKMLTRLRGDSYISKMLAMTEGGKSDTKDIQTHHQLCLAQASIYVNATKFEMEERVDVSESVAETLRRSLWPSIHSSLDVVEVILALPSLPCRTPGSKTRATTRLANRAKLRMLEDAMLDECEKEGDDQIIEDLNISNEQASSKEDIIEHESADSSSRKKKKSKR
ncbi:unnamed protein product [Pseudo-nitzschia multistriata]|uniref:Uncharacterized protein n=1 Tax=Pseudo-nitzschia multistriata TaxID=183589 RepID=A0A448ZFZ4_9STRA|nr:unnamed protein product [Pseudo-nitzschia multistriata]